MPDGPHVTVLGVLYHLSTDDRHKEQFSLTDCISLAMRLLLDPQAPQTDIHLLALCINLAASERNAELICAKNGLKFLIKRPFFRFAWGKKLLFVVVCSSRSPSSSSPSSLRFLKRTTIVEGALTVQDSLLFKMIRNLSEHANVKKVPKLL